MRNAFRDGSVGFALLRNCISGVPVDLQFGDFGDFDDFDRSKSIHFQLLRSRLPTEIMVLVPSDEELLPGKDGGGK